jgi:hypothetical protein
MQRTLPFAVTIWLTVAICLATAILVALPPTAVLAEMRGETYEAELFGGLYSPSPPELDSNVCYGLRFGYNVTENLQLLGELGFMDTSGRFETFHGEFGNITVTLDYRVVYIGLPLVLNFKAGERWNPSFFIGPGFGIVSFDARSSDERYRYEAEDVDGNSFTFQTGLGVRGSLNRHLFVRALGQMRYFAVRDRDKLDLEVTAAVGYTFGK